ncbi:DUF2971 domain-containing protein [Neptuniibacter sp.]|uniref:DUF2971 domain-containing protein n=1 Tax=Neptuniibacter sp. TaxID=1962643 RepID=UPI003B5BCB6C
MSVIYRYKYLPFDSETSLKVITESTIKFSSPEEFNDPFDCAPYLDVSEITDEYVNELLKKNGTSPADRIQNKQKYKCNLIRAIESGDFLKSINSSISICCLSRSATQPLMWAHYANDHRGFVVEFKIPVEGELSVAHQHDEFLVPFSVEYTQERPQTHIVDNEPDQVEKCLLTKCDDWAYEEEERVISYQRPAGIHQISPLLLSSVIAGMRMPAKDVELLNEAIQQHNQTHKKDVSLYHARPDQREYLIKVDGHPRL